MLNDIGVYCVSLAQWIFRNEKPDQISAIGYVENEFGQWGVITLQYSRNRKAVLNFSGIHFTPIDAIITCENGRYNVRHFYR